MADANAAVVHDWLINDGGAEAVLAELLTLHAPADLFTLFDRFPGAARSGLSYESLQTSWFNRLPGLSRWYRHMLPLMPAAIESLDLRGHELVVSDSHVVAKGVITDPDQVHVSYCFTPMRFAWDLRHEYMSRFTSARRTPTIPRDLLLSRIRLWDYVASQRPERLVACSEFVARRIRKFYGRQAPVVYPPVPVDEFAIDEPDGGFHVAVGRPAPNKRLESVVEAFRHLPNHKLVVIGPSEWNARKHRLPANVEVLPRLERASYRRYLAAARALVHVGVEDFGITLVEAQAAGTPVIAFAGGAAPEIVRPVGSHRHPTGVLCDDPSPERVADVVAGVDATLDHVSPQACRENARRFDRSRFHAQWQEQVDAALDRSGRRGAQPVAGGQVP